MRWVAFAKPDLVCADNYVPDLIDSSAAGTPEHLENFVRSERVLHVITPIRFSGQRNAAEREIDPCGQTHRRDHNSKLSGFCQRLDDTGAGGIAQFAVMICDSVLEHFGQVLADELLLIETKSQRIRCGQITAQLRRK